MERAKINYIIYETAKTKIEKEFERAEMQLSRENEKYAALEYLENRLWSEIIYFGAGLSENKLNVKEIIEIKEIIWSEMIEKAGI